MALIFALLLSVGAARAPDARSTEARSTEARSTGVAAACRAHARDLAIVARYFVTVMDYVTLQMIVSDFAKEPDVADAWVTEKGVHVAHSDRAKHGRPSDPRYQVSGDGSSWSGANGTTIAGVPLGNHRGDAFVQCKPVE